MARYCAVFGCGKRPAGYSRYCNRHKIARARHGDAEQLSIRASDIKPHMRHIEKWIAKRKNAEALWSSVHLALDKCVLAAEAELSAVNCSGTAWRRWAYEDIVKIANEVDRNKIILTTMAVAYLAAYEPRAFKSDRAVRFQMARRFRALSAANTAEYYSCVDGRRHRVYRSSSPRHSEFLGRTLFEVLGVHGLAIYAKEETERLRTQEARDAALRAINEAQEAA